MQIYYFLPVSPNSAGKTDQAGVSESDSRPDLFMQYGLLLAVAANNVVALHAAHFLDLCVEAAETI